MDHARHGETEAHLSAEDGVDPVGMDPLYHYSVRAKSLKSRLALQGFGLAQLTRHPIAYLASERDDEERFTPDSWQVHESAFGDAEGLLTALLKWKAAAGRTKWWLPPENSHDQYVSS
jgi:hypothetical protein